MKFTILVCFFLSALHASKEVSQDWGYVTVRPRAHMFWWLYYTKSMANNTNQENKPLIIWLQGGPGDSSTGVGNFLLIGPEDINAQLREHTWVYEYNVLFIDSPVGAGFSYTESEFAFPTSNTEIAEDLLRCINEFLKLKPDFMRVPIFIAGESYGAKMAIEFANMWYKSQSDRLINSNLKGVLLGNPWISPERIISHYGSLLLNWGFVDKEGHEDVQRWIREIQSNMEYNRWLDATNNWLKLKRVILNLTNNLDFNNVLNVMQSYDYTNLNRVRNSVPEYKLNLHMNEIVRKRLSINSTVWGRQRGDVQFFLYEDLMKSVFNEVQYTLQSTKLKVYIYAGQLGVTVDVSGTVDWIDHLDWAEAHNWKQARRKAMIIDGVVEGYFKKYGRLAMYWINRSGQMVPKDNPVAALQVMRDLANHI